MANWGYSISKDQQIDIDKIDRTLVGRILSLEPSFKACIACGSCAATCSTQSVNGTFSLRKTNLLLARGQMDDLKNEISQCMLCGKCTLVCPRGVNTRHVIVIVKNLLN